MKCGREFAASHPRMGRFTSKRRCQCGCRMLADFSLLIRFDHFRVAD